LVFSDPYMVMVPAGADDVPGLAEALKGMTNESFSLREKVVRRRRIG
jgi:hypothetical protein